MPKTRIGAFVALLMFPIVAFSAPPLKFSVQVNLTGNGTVTSSPGGIDCPTTCVASYKQGTNISLTATPAAGQTFISWAGACSGTGSCSISAIQADVLVTAEFSSNGGGGAPTITEVYIDVLSQPKTLTVIGTNLDAISTATLGANELLAQGSTLTAYTAFLPSILADGDYLLTLTNSAGSVTWQLTYPATGPEGPPGEHLTVYQTSDDNPFLIGTSAGGLIRTLTLTVPAGSYVLLANAQISFFASAVTVLCRLIGPGESPASSPTYGMVGIETHSSNEVSNIPLMATLSVQESTAVSIACYHTGPTNESAFVGRRWIVGLQTSGAAF